MLTITQLREDSAKEDYRAINLSIKKLITIDKYPIFTPTIQRTNAELTNELINMGIIPYKRQSISVYA